MTVEYTGGIRYVAGFSCSQEEFVEAVEKAIDADPRDRITVSFDGKDWVISYPESCT